MIRFALSLLVAAGAVVGGYSALGHAAGVEAAQPLKIIATVTVHGHRHTALSGSRYSQQAPLI